MTGGQRSRAASSAAILVVSLITAISLDSGRAAAQSQAATIIGRVRVASTELPLGYAVIGIGSPPREQFADANGQFTVQVQAGRVALSAKRVGYAPFDTTVNVAAGDTARLVLDLALITIRLPAIQSFAQACLRPGASPSAVGVELALLLDQVRQNADRNRLLSRTYPFELRLERRISRPEPSLEARFVAYDTILMSSNRAWRYAPGHMLGTRDIDGGVFGGRWVTLMMPELSDIADDAFINNHCFDYGGPDVVNGDTLIRVEFSPAPFIHAPDVTGTMFLDSKTFQLRRTLIALANPNKQLRESVSSQTIEVFFSEVIPGVPVLDRVSSLVYPHIDSKNPPVEPSTERLRMLGVRFVSQDPRRP